MTKYIIALLFPWLSFFLRGKIFYGLLALVFPFVISYFFHGYTKIPTFGPLFKALSFVIACVPNVWAIYAVYLSEKKEMLKRASELS